MANYDSNNIFAKILRDEIPSKKVLETDRVVCFMQTNEGRILPAKRGCAEMLCKKIGVVHKRFFIDASQADQAV